MRKFPGLVLSAAALFATASSMLAAGCSSTVPLNPDAGLGGGGAGGSTVGGSGGERGTGGAGALDGGASCQSLIDDYTAAYALARACSPALTTAPCTHLVSPSLQCPICQFHVTDTSALDVIRAAYEASDCPPVPCPAIACVTAGTGACVANDSGSSAGTCVDLR